MALPTNCLHFRESLSPCPAKHPVYLNIGTLKVICFLPWGHPQKLPRAVLWFADMGTWWNAFSRIYTFFFEVALFNIFPGLNLPHLSSNESMHLAVIQVFCAHKVGLLGRQGQIITFSCRHTFYRGCLNSLVNSLIPKLQNVINVSTKILVRKSKYTAKTE